MTPLTQVISTQTQTQINSNSSQTHHGVAYYILTYATYVDRDDGTEWMLLHILDGDSFSIWTQNTNNKTDTYFSIIEIRPG